MTHMFIFHHQSSWMQNVLIRGFYSVSTFSSMIKSKTASGFTQTLRLELWLMVSCCFEILATTKVKIKRSASDKEEKEQVCRSWEFFWIEITSS